MNYTLTGKLVALSNRITLNTRAGNAFGKRLIKVQTDDQMPAHAIYVEFAGNRCDLPANFEEGEEVEVDFTIRCREWAGRDGKRHHATTLLGIDIRRKA